MLVTLYKIGEVHLRMFGTNDFRVEEKKLTSAGFVGGRSRVRLRLDHQSGSQNNWGESPAFSLVLQVLLDKDYNP